MKRIFSILFALVLAVSLMLVPAASVGASPGPGIVGLWHFDEGSGQMAADATGVNDGQLGSTPDVDINDPTWVSPGKFGNALSFDGSNDYVLVADDDTLDITTAITIEAWINPTMLGGWKYIVSKRSGTVANYGFRLWGQKVEFYYRGSTGWQVWQSTSNVVSTGSWQHVAVAFTFGSGSPACYVNGAPVVGSWTWGDGTESATANTLPLRIGALHPGNPLSFDGEIDGVGIWDEARTASQIQQSYAALHVDDDGAEWPGAYPTITEALAVAGSGDTIIVHQGTYPETLVVDKQLTLQGAGSASTIIDASGASADYGILLTAGGTSASQRLTIKGFTIKNSPSHGIKAYKSGGLNLDYVTFEDLVLTLNGVRGMEIHNDVAVSDMEIKSCEFVRNVAQGLRTASNVIVDGMTITDSKFNRNSYGVYLQGTINGVTILRSEFNNSVGGYGGYMTETGPLTNLVIEDSEFNNNVVGLMVWNVQDNAGITIRRASFQDNNKWGALIWGNTLTDVLIEDSTVLNNDGLSAGYYGMDFYTYNDVMTNVAVHFTDITGHTMGGGVKNRNTVDTAIVDATNNWWGSPTGPSRQLPNGKWVGKGDKVSANVAFVPWLPHPTEFWHHLPRGR